VGASAFAHKGGIHVNAVNKLSASYEHIKPELVGNQQRVLVGELAGRANIMLKARTLGLQLEEKSPEAMKVLDEVKRLENQGYEFEAADASFELLVRKKLQDRRPFFELDEYHISARKNMVHGFATCEATVKLRVGGEVFHEVADGDGPVNALDAALRCALVKRYPQLAKVHLIDYKVRIINSSGGTAARIRVLIESSDGVNEWGTVGVSENVIEASWMALTDSFEYYLGKNPA
jgi:2-isopropylmalate synthase